MSFIINASDIRHGIVDIRLSMLIIVIRSTHAMGGLDEAPPVPVGLGIGDLFVV